MNYPDETIMVLKGPLMALLLWQARSSVILGLGDWSHETGVHQKMTVHMRWPQSWRPSFPSLLSDKAHSLCGLPAFHLIPEWVAESSSAQKWKRSQENPIVTVNESACRSNIHGISEGLPIGGSVDPNGLFSYSRDTDWGIYICPVSWHVNGGWQCSWGGDTEEKSFHIFATPKCRCEWWKVMSICKWAALIGRGVIATKTGSVETAQQKTQVQLPQPHGGSQLTATPGPWDVMLSSYTHVGRTPYS